LEEATAQTKATAHKLSVCESEAAEAAAKAQKKKEDMIDEHK